MSFYRLTPTRDPSAEWRDCAVYMVQRERERPPLSRAAHTPQTRLNLFSLYSLSHTLSRSVCVCVCVRVRACTSLLFRSFVPTYIHCIATTVRSRVRFRLDFSTPGNCFAPTDTTADPPLAPTRAMNCRFA